MVLKPLVNEIHCLSVLPYYFHILSSLARVVFGSFIPKRVEGVEPVLIASNVFQTVLYVILKRLQEVAHSYLRSFKVAHAVEHAMSYVVSQRWHGVSQAGIISYKQIEPLVEDCACEFPRGFTKVAHRLHEVYIHIGCTRLYKG